MRKRKHLVGAVAAVILSMAVASVAQADYTLQGQSLVVDAAAGKLDKKKPGAVNSLFLDVITNYTGTTGAVDRKATNTKVYFSKDYAFKTTGLSQCDPNGAGFGTSTTEAAKAQCGAAQVGSGSAADRRSDRGHHRRRHRVQRHSSRPVSTRSCCTAATSASTTTVARRHPEGEQCRPASARCSTCRFRPLPLATRDQRLPRRRSPRSSCPRAARRPAAARRRRRSRLKYYIMAKCSKKKWNFQATTTYNTGPDSVATSSAKCKQKKKKKKK